jgi:hypothetical protein
VIQAIGAVVCLKALRHDDERLARRDLRLGLEQVRQALRDMLDEHPVRADRDAKELVRWLATVTSVPQAELTEVLGVGARTDDGRVVLGFGSGRGYGFDELRDDCGAVGLRAEVELSTWDLRPFTPDATFLVAVLGRAS